jgi:[protein-PII] uridylyltransferase
LYDLAEERLRLGHKQKGRSERVAAIRAELREILGWEEARFATFAARLPDSYWIAEPMDVLESNARFVEAAEHDGAGSVSIGLQEKRGATLISVYAEDRPGLFYRLVGAISLAGANIIDARIHTSGDGRALDNFLIQDPSGAPFRDPHQVKRLQTAVQAAIAGEEPPMERLHAKPPPLVRSAAFAVQPAVFIDNSASARYTVVEVNARDRAALLSGLALAIVESKAVIRSAHIATYGERAVDVFYLTDAAGAKIEAPARLKSLQSRLLKAAGSGETEQAAA